MTFLVPTIHQSQTHLKTTSISELRPKHKDPSCESKIMAPQNGAYPSHARDMRTFWSGSSKKIPHRNIACHISLVHYKDKDYEMLKDARSLALT